jgi:hypothetical protein
MLAVLVPIFGLDPAKLEQQLAQTSDNIAISATFRWALEVGHTIDAAEFCTENLLDIK